MSKLLKSIIFFPLLIVSTSAVAFSEMPAICSSEFKDKVLPYIQELEKAGPPELIKQIKKSKSTDLISYHMSYGQNIRNKWFYGKDSKIELMKMYNVLGIRHIDDMSQDLIEGIWVNGSDKAKRCQILTKQHAKIKDDLGRIETIPPDAPEK